MQLLLQLDTTDFDGWKTDWDTESSERMEAGITQLQMWRDADTRTRVLVLLQANRRAAAEAWLRKERGFGGLMTATFLDLA